MGELDTVEFAETLAFFSIRQKDIEKRQAESAAKTKSAAPQRGHKLTPDEEPLSMGSGSGRKRAKVKP